MKILLLLGFALLAPASGAPASSPWRSVESAGWQVVTDAGPGAAAAHLEALQDARRLLAAGELGLRVPSRPLRVLLLSAGRDFAPFRRIASQSGLFQPSAEADFIVLQSGGVDSVRAVRHEYVHLALHYGAGPLPRWLAEGLGEYYSTLRAGTTEAVVGEAVAAHVVGLSMLGAAWRADVFTAVAEQTQFAGDTAQAAAYYAQAWALVHYLMDQPAGPEKMARLIAHLRDGQPEAEALLEAFAIPLARALPEARVAAVAGRSRLRRVRLAAGTGVARPRALDEVEARLRLAEAMLACGFIDDGERVQLDLLKAHPNHPHAVAGLGYLALRRGDRPAARREFQRALDLDDGLAGVHFELAMLLREAGAATPEVERHLRRTVQLDPLNDAAWYQLAQFGRGGEAVECLRQAVAARADRSQYWDALARALWAGGQTEEARRAAAQARQTAATTAEKEMAAGLTRELDAPPAPPPSRAPARAAVRSEPSAMRMSGWLLRVSCEGFGLRFYVRNEQGREVRLDADDPAQVRLEGPPEQAPRRFTCGDQRPAPRVEVTYRPVAVGAADGLLLGIAFR